MRLILDSPLENMTPITLDISSVVGVSKGCFDYAYEALKRNPKKEFIKFSVCICREPINGEIAFRFTPD